MEQNITVQPELVQFVDNDIKVFNSPMFGDVRTSGTSDNPLFCLADVCKALGLRQGDVKCRLSDGLVSTQPIIDNLGRQQQANFVNEDGLYDVILDSRKAEAKMFRKWVTSEILPSIRKTGGYIATTAEMSDDEIMSRALIVAQATIAKHQQRIAQLSEENERQHQQIKADEPKVLFANAVQTSSRSCLVAELAKILRQNGVDMGQNRLYRWLRDNGYLCKSGLYYNQPTQSAMEMGLFELKQTTITTPNGEIIVKTTTKVSGKGQIYFIDKFLGDKSA